MLNFGRRFLSAKGIETAYKEAEDLLLFLLKKDRSSFYKDLHIEVQEPFILKYKNLLEKRTLGTPLQYILQEIDFCSIKLKITKGVFIPRPETELLVDEIINAIKKRGLQNSHINILDLGTGTGAIILSLIKELKESFGVGIDINPIALSLSWENAYLNKLEDRVFFVEGDIFSPEQFTISKKFDIIVTNPPYIPDEDMMTLQKEVKNEPFLALEGGKDGLTYYPYVFEWGVSFLKKDGLLAFEMGKGQWKRIKQIASEYGFRNVDIKRDYNGIERVGIVWK